MSFLIQYIKASSTLRVSSKNQKLPPRIVYRYGCQNDQIRNFLDYHVLIKNCKN